VITAALVVVPGPGDTVTFVWQERGPYAGWWLLPGGKVEFGEPVAAAARREAAEESGCDPGDLVLTGAYAGAAAYPGELIAGRLARERIAMTNLLTGETVGRPTVPRPVTEAVTTARSE